MIETTLPPSRLLKAGATAAKWALWMVVLAWIAVAIIWGVLHFLIVPRIAELRPVLEQYASKTLGVQVRVGALAAQSNGFIPAFELRNVTLVDAQNREVLRLPLVVGSVSPRSAMTLGFEQLYIESPVLDVRRAKDGRIWVAGLLVNPNEQEDSAATDWLFSQAELAIRHGTVNWTDETRNVAPLALSDVDLVLRNGLRSHNLQLDATPPAEWGQRLSVMGRFKPSRFLGRSGDWQQWQGQLYASLPQVDLGQLRRYVKLGVDVRQGEGAVRAWVDVVRGQATGAVVDVALTGVDVRVDPKLDALSMRHMSGRLGAKRLDEGLEFSTQALQFETQDGLRWPGGNVRVGLIDANGRNPARGELGADRLDLAAMVQIAQRLPLGEEAHGVLQRLDPKGLVEQVQGTWSGPWQQPTSYSARGRVTQLEVQAADHNGTLTPGVKGVDVSFEVSPAGGKASVAMQGGSFNANGVFADPLIAFDQLKGDVLWKTEGSRLSVTVPAMHFGNADAQGELQAKWQTAEVSVPKAGQTPAAALAARFPGVLDLQGTLSRAEGKQVYRYLPLELDVQLRDYLRDAIVAGTGSNVKFKVKGNLKDFPFTAPGTGEFRISAHVQDASLAFAPPSILPKDSLPWPTLTQLSGELAIDHTSLQVRGAQAGVLGLPGLQISKADATINNLYDDAALVVNAQAHGPLAHALGLIKGSPLGGLTNHALAQATVSGDADYRFTLALPIDVPEKAKVQGTVTLGGNALQISADTPRLSATRGVVSFSETGFSVAGGQARALGGDVRLEGGLSVVPAVQPLVMRIQGTASAEGLKQATELGFVARLGQYASGQAAYNMVLGLRDGVLELQINSNLVGLGLSLPAPLDKAPQTPLALRLDTSAVRTSPPTGVAVQDQLQMNLGQLAHIVYVRDITGPSPRVLRGAIGVGLAADESAPLPGEGVVANIRMDRVDLDAWSQVLSSLSGVDLAAGPPTTGTNPIATPSLAYLPTTMAVRARELTTGGRKLNNVVVGGGREGLLWRANLDATELNGYVEYRQPADTAPGRFYGRLARLAIGPSTAQEVESLLDQQPTSIPALDVVIDDFELRGKKLGRLEIDAVNLGATGPRETSTREWRLNRFNIITPEAVLTASGNWTDINAQAAAKAPSSKSIKERRRTVLNFKLDIANAGELLQRFAMPGVIGNGRGKIEGRVDWQGSPITLDYASLGGNFNVNVESGQFLKTEPGIAKLLGVLSLQSLPRRLALDFRDVFTDGFSFDFLRGDVVIEHGIARTNNLQMKGVNAAVLMEGQADIAKETQAIKVVVVPEINAGSASLIATVINPVVGLTTFLAQLILRKPLIESNTQEFFIDGSWVDPRVTKVDRNAAPPPPAPAKAGAAK